MKLLIVADLNAAIQIAGAAGALAEIMPLLAGPAKEYADAVVNASAPVTDEKGRALLEAIWEKRRLATS